MKIIFCLVLLTFSMSARAEQFYCQNDSDCGSWAHCYEGGNCIDDVENGYTGVPASLKLCGVRSPSIFISENSLVDECQRNCVAQAKTCTPFNSTKDFQCKISNRPGGPKIALGHFHCAH